jgi:hypothetical protein
MTNMSTATDQFKLLGPDGQIIACGSLNAVTQPILGSKSRADALDLIKRADAAAEQEREREQQERVVVAEGARALADGIAQLSRRLDALVQSRDARRRLDAVSEATRHMLELPKDPPELDLSDNTPAPSGELRPLQAKDPPEHDPTADDQGDLPRELERGAPPMLGTEPTIEDPPRRQVSQPVAFEG